MLAADTASSDLLEEFLNSLEDRSSVLWIIHLGGHGHETPDTNRDHGLDLFDQMPDGCRGNAMTPSVITRIDLDENLDGRLGIFRAGLDLFRQAK